MGQILEVTLPDGEAVLRDPTPSEVAQREIDAEADRLLAAEREAEAAAAAAARDAAITHAKSLGFTDEMIAVMYPGLNTSAV